MLTSKWHLYMGIWRQRCPGSYSYFMNRPLWGHMLHKLMNAILSQSLVHKSTLDPVVTSGMRCLCSNGYFGRLCEGMCFNSNFELEFDYESWFMNHKLWCLENTSKGGLCTAGVCNSNGMCSLSDSSPLGYECDCNGVSALKYLTDNRQGYREPFVHRLWFIKMTQLTWS